MKHWHIETNPNPPVIIHFNRVFPYKPSSSIRIFPLKPPNLWWWGRSPEEGRGRIAQTSRSWRLFGVFAAEVAGLAGCCRGTCAFSHFYCGEWRMKLPAFYWEMQGISVLSRYIKHWQWCFILFRGSILHQGCFLSKVLENSKVFNTNETLVQRMQSALSAWFGEAMVRGCWRLEVYQKLIDLNCQKKLTDLEVYQKLINLNCRGLSKTHWPQFIPIFLSPFFLLNLTDHDSSMMTQWFCRVKLFPPPSVGPESKSRLPKRVYASEQKLRWMVVISLCFKKWGGHTGWRFAR